MKGAVDSLTPAPVALGDYKALLYEDTFEIEVGLRSLTPLLTDSLGQRPRDPAKSYSCSLKQL